MPAPPSAATIRPQLASAAKIEDFTRFEDTTAFAKVLACSSVSALVTVTAILLVTPSASDEIFFARKQLMLWTNLLNMI